MQTQKFMPDATLKERRELLHASADKVEEGSYYKPLTEDELNAAKDDLTDAVIETNRLMEEKAELAKALNEQIKTKKVETKNLLTMIKTRQVEKVGVTYEMHNHTTGMLECYDEDGDLLYTRRLKPDERQKTIMNEARLMVQD